MTALAKGRGWLAAPVLVSLATAGAARAADDPCKTLHQLDDTINALAKAPATVGPLGQLLAAAASLGGVFLAVTGISLSLRRFLSWRLRRAEAAAASRRATPPMAGEGQDLAPAKGALR